MNIFNSTEDRINYLMLMSESADKHSLQINAYCLMDNHIHMIVTPPTVESLAKGIGDAHKRFTRRQNLKTDTRGYLFQGRFFSNAMDDDYANKAFTYIHYNPVRARMVAAPEDYIWSSAAFHMGQVAYDPLVKHRSLVPQNKYNLTEADIEEFERKIGGNRALGKFPKEMGTQKLLCPQRAA